MKSVVGIHKCHKDTIVTLLLYRAQDIYSKILTHKINKKSIFSIDKLNIILVQ